MKCPQCQAENTPDSRYCSKCATPLPQADTKIVGLTETFQTYIRELPRGTVFAGRYEVIEELGKGGMGRVYRVFDRKLQEPVALKLLNPEISFNAQAVERFRNELRFARKIAHRNVVRLFDLGEEGFSHYITMEYVEGENLKRFIKRSVQLNPSKAAGLALQVCEGLAEAHRLGVVHRDLKPQNIMIDPEGNARILDFGIARFVDSETVTASGVMIGTPEYMSPEQIDMKEVDGRSDIYSLGIILFEMLTGKVPFEGETPISVALKHKSQPAMNPRELNPQVDAALAGVVLRCLEKDRSRRYQSAGELAGELDRVLQGLPTTEISRPQREPITSREITVKFRPGKLLVPVLVVAGLAGLVFIGRPLLFKPGPAAPAGRTLLDRRASLPASPEPPPPGTRAVSSPTGRPSSTGGVLGWLSGEARKYVSPEDLAAIKDPQLMLLKLKEGLPKDSDLGPWVDKAIQKIDEGKRLDQEGRPDLARKSHEEGQLQMKELLNLVSRRQAVQDVRDIMTRAKDQARAGGASEKNLLFLVAQNEESSAEEAMLKDDFSGAQTLYRVLARVYRLSPGCPDDQACLKAIQDSVASQAREVGRIGGDRVDLWTLNFAEEVTKQARTFVSLNQLPNAVASYIQASFLYEKIKEQAGAAS
jgi:serine/threonine protein kinase